MTSKTLSIFRIHICYSLWKNRHTQITNHAFTWLKTWHTLPQVLACQRFYSSDNGAGNAAMLADELQFLQTFYTSDVHGVLSIEKGCRRFCDLYRSMDTSSRLSLLCHIGESYGVDQRAIVDVAQKVIDSQARGEVLMLRTLERLRRALTPRYQLLLGDIGRLEGGVKFLADMRADILNMLSTTSSDLDRAHLEALQSCLRELLSLWFTMGFLQLERATWHSSCDMLQKISEYEVVHPVRHWADMKRRVGPYRRCYVFTHNSMPREPIVVLHCALTKDIASSIHSILDMRGYSEKTEMDLTPPMEEVEKAEHITTAMFYSVTSTQKGLQGVDLGNYLIKRAAVELQKEWPQITQFSSISPIPGFRDWLTGEINRQCGALKDCSLKEEQYLITQNEISSLCTTDSIKPEALMALERLKDHVINVTWTRDQDIVTAVKPILMRLCARYLYREKRRGYALNTVANFHLQNGAVLWRLNWAADNSSRGLSSSCGLMVNYRYFLQDTVTYSQEYIEHKQIRASQQIKELC
ncbi:malonyl-CoA decarboxylase, mitochondrial-like [Dreissena polymorpha]|uniref:malonyl-CoA decarboxylase, mitochondrial-like n=1 Tax=Dreissena polymorpha TaxID=45954 RepID=UPI0022650AD9|nr:malonyl-CoA decarboxylase, mitochondrial-like [Dreissena polymorpha]